MTATALIASAVAAAIDHALVRAGFDAAWLHGAGEPDGARALLSTMAGSTITVAGVTFSTILVALSLTSSQYGPRLLRGFLRDRGNQAVLGTFIATYVYCLLVLRNVPMVAGGTQVPQVSVLLAMALGLAGVMELIWFIHHAASSIQASSVIEMAGVELDDALRQSFPLLEEDGGLWRDQAPAEFLPDGFDEEAVEVLCTTSGYIQEVDVAGLVAVAQEHDLLIQLLHDRGSFLADGQLLARVSRVADEELNDAITGALVFGPSRSSSRDVVRAVSQLSEVAVRALSPGINDPFTAGNAMRRLGQSLSILGERHLPTPAYHDAEGDLRVVMPTPTIDEILHAAFDRVRHYGASDPLLPVELLEVFAVIGAEGRHPGLRRALLRHAEAVKQLALEALMVETDRDRVEATWRTAQAVLQGRQVP
jgi:uncharacterized membrane protein